MNIYIGKPIDEMTCEEFKEKTQPISGWPNLAIERKGKITLKEDHK